MDEISGMENKLFEEDQVSPDSRPTRCQETSETMNEEYETKAEEWECQFEVQHILREPESSSLSYLINCNETSVEPGMVKSSVTAADEPDIKHFCEELLYSSTHKSKYNPVHLPLHTACPSPFLPRGSSDEIPERVHKIRVRKHKPSAISFSDFEFLSLGTNAKFHICEVTETSEEDEERGGDDDVFTELPQPGVFLNGLHKRAVSQGKGEEQEHCTSQHIHHVENSCEHSEGNLDSYKREEKQIALVTQPETGSEWSDSMSYLMKKLEQLNLDIEEALSAGSSPTNTPCTKRRKETCAIKVETDHHRDHQRKGICTRKRAGYQELDGLPCPVSSGARPKTDVLFQKLSREKAEIEAKETCDWLRAAGFPQYAHLYEDSQFPIDIAAVKTDHDFLDKDLVEPLCRRLNTLNKCASMKLDVNFQRKKSEDSDEEDLCAISNKWTFQRTSRRWSRVDDIDTLLHRSGRHGSSGDIKMKNTTSSESVLTDLSEPDVSSIHSESSGGSDNRSPSGISSTIREVHDSSGEQEVESTHMHDSSSVISTQDPKDIIKYSLNIKNEKPTRTRAKTFLKRMETLKAKGTHGKLRGSGKTVVLDISGPVLQYEPKSLKDLHCVEIVNGDLQNLAQETVKKGLSFSGKSSNDSSQSENSSSGVSTPCLKERKCQETNKRSGMYLEDLDVLSGATLKQVVDQNHKNEFHSQEDLVVHIPKDHKPGTFPKALSIESLSPTDNGNNVNWRTGSISLGKQKCSTPREVGLITCCPKESRVSIYDNVPGSHLYASTGDLLDLEKDELFPHLDDILQHVNGLQEVVDHWSKNVLPDMSNNDLSVGESTSLPFQSTTQITLDFEGNSVSDGRTTPSDMDRDGTSLNESEATGVRDRRDSGVGASLTRPSRRLRWNSFQISHSMSHSIASLQISNQSAVQLNLLQKFSLLCLTAIMEKYSMSNKHGWTWSVPKFMKRMKVPDYKDKNVFGVPLIVHVQRTGQPLPQSIQQALRYLRSNCLDQVGLFRKSGVKSRIQALRQMNESSPENVRYEDQSAYDVADMVKQFFRDLPEPLLTSKLGETFLHIYQYVPQEQRVHAVQAAIMLMSDENREALQTLLCFLSDVTSVEENQMTPMNLAVCLAPSLFHLNIVKKESSPRVIQKKYATGKPDQKDLSENLAATQGLAHMIMECNKLFEVPHDMVAQSRNSYVEAEIHSPTLEELGKQIDEEGGTYQMYIESLLQNLQKEAKEKFKGWITCPSIESTELTYKKVGDGNPLRLWKVSVEVEAPPSVVLNQVLRERHLWDEDFLQWKIIETLDKQTEIYQYVLNSMAPHPVRDFVVLRTWRTDLPKGMCMLVAVSVEHEEAPLMGSVRAIVMDSQYLIEPCGSGKSRLTHICRIDLKGHSPEWYNKVFGHLCAAEVARIRNSFQPLIAEGPETKI
ncbi:PREDICTED: stAR-related lipid transfer protein 13 isoform X3 [Gavialis gangeticus]|uniref:stAR-related lipid transfer protein 13 isoform X3 n=2 Tax=Gavialis gangeticus TaxID=94835 RepID=UPI00092E97FC|nr:PREDICTED: stAR-related lipid transfer protein 13 isoform X3 [Gavialis gangeticus]